MLSLNLPFQGYPGTMVPTVLTRPCQFQLMCASASTSHPGSGPGVPSADSDHSRLWPCFKRAAWQDHGLKRTVLTVKWESLPRRAAESNRVGYCVRAQCPDTVALCKPYEEVTGAPIVLTGRKQRASQISLQEQSCCSAAKSEITASGSVVVF